MENKKQTAIKMLGVGLIGLSLCYLIGGINIVVSKSQIDPLLFGAEFLEFLAVVASIATSEIWSSFVFCLVTGIGVLKLKLWARYLCLILVINFSINIFFSIWLFGFQMHWVLYYAVWASILISAFIFLNKKSVREQFGVGFKKINLLAKILIGCSLMIIIFKLLFMGVWIGYFNNKVVIKTPKPEKVTYKISDQQYLLNNYKKQYLFGYSIYLPKELEIVSIDKSVRSSDWNLFFVEEEKEEIKSNFVLSFSNKTLGDQCFTSFSNLKFKSPYELERKLHYPTSSPLYSALKLILHSNTEKVEDITSLNWHGFGRINYNEKNNKWTFKYSLYDLKNLYSASIDLVFNKQAVDTQQVKDLITSLSFEKSSKSDIEFFNEGKIALSKKDYTEAVINFVNALYLNDQKPEYAYYIARSLFEDDRKKYIISRMAASKRFLGYTLALDSQHRQAQETLSLVDKKIEKEKAERAKRDKTQK